MANVNEEPLVVRGNVKMDDGNPPDNRARLKLLLLDSQTSNAIRESTEETATDDQGRFEFKVDVTGFPQIWSAQGRARFVIYANADPRLSDDAYGAFTKNQRTVENISLTFPSPTGQGTGSNGQTPDYSNLLNEAIDVITTLGGRATGVTSPRPVGSGQDLDRFFDDAVLKVLGTRVRPDQPDELLNAFDRVFIEKEVDGRNVVEYRGTSGTATLPREPGQVSSGPQAVLYRRASAELPSVKQALAELAADDDDRQDEFEAVRDVIDHKLTELVEALGQDIRPPISRVEAIFSLLIGPNRDIDQKSYLGQLRRLIGFKGRGLVDPDDMTRDEDRTSTRYLEIQFYLVGLSSNWEKVRDYFQDQSTSAPLGSRLDMLGLQLDRLAEVTDDLDIALTADSIDSAEREFLVIQDRTKTTPETSISELMEWLWDFARTSKSLDSRKGIEAVKLTADDIEKLVDSALAKAKQPNPVPGLRNRQVRRALEDIKNVLGMIQKV